jgi:hypothetical protein
VRRKAGKLTQVIFDSGSSYTYLPHDDYTNLIASLKSLSPSLLQDESDRTLPFCMKPNFPVRSMDDVKHLFKPLSLVFKKRLFILPRTFVIPPEDYLIISVSFHDQLSYLSNVQLNFGHLQQYSLENFQQGEQSHTISHSSCFSLESFYRIRTISA